MVGVSERNLGPVSKVVFGPDIFMLMLLLVLTLVCMLLLVSA